MNSSADMTAILEDLAAGRNDAAEANRRIEALRQAAPAPAPEPEESPRPTEPTAPRAGLDDPVERWRGYARETFNRVRETATAAAGMVGEPITDTQGVEVVSVRAIGRRVRVIADPRVATATVEGQHILRRTGSVMEITAEGELGPSLDGFTFLKPPRSLEEVRNLSLGKELVVRINPALVLDVELTAGLLTTEEVRLLGKVRVTAGGAKVSGFHEARDVLIQAGQATMGGTVTTGRSRVRCESGSLAITLADQSNVTVGAEAQLGKVAWSGQHTGAGDEVVMGNGSARLDVGVVMGHATVKLGDEVKEENR